MALARLQRLEEWLGVRPYSRRAALAIGHLELFWVGGGVDKWEILLGKSEGGAYCDLTSLNLEP